MQINFHRHFTRHWQCSTGTTETPPTVNLVALFAWLIDELIRFHRQLALLGRWLRHPVRFRARGIARKISRYDARGVDTWCAGVCLYTMVTGNLPFQGSNVDDTLDAVRTKEIEFPKQLSPLLTVSDRIRSFTFTLLELTCNIVMWPVVSRLSARNLKKCGNEDQLTGQ